MLSYLTARTATLRPYCDQVGPVHFTRSPLYILSLRLDCNQEYKTKSNIVLQGECIFNNQKTSSPTLKLEKLSQPWGLSQQSITEATVCM